MTITPFAAGSFASRETSRMFVDMRRAAETLELQMASGRRSETYSGLGFDRRSSLDLRAKLSGLETYQTTIQKADFRLRATLDGVESLEKIASKTRSAAMEPLTGLSASGVPQEQALARNNLAFAVQILNTEVDGTHLFAGRASDTAPVQNVDAIMTGLDTYLTTNGVDRTVAGDVFDAVEAFFADSANWQAATRDNAGDPRESVIARVDDGQSVAVGARADEEGFRRLLVGLAALSVADASDTGMGQTGFAALSSRVAAHIATDQPQPRDIAGDLGRAQATMAAVKDRHETGRALLQEALDGVENVSTEEAAVSLLNLQTRMQASFQTTAILSRLSLVNFL